MLGDEDTFPYVLALDLGLTLGQLDLMGQREYMRWEAFYEVRRAEQRLEIDHAAKRHQG